MFSLQSLFIAFLFDCFMVNFRRSQFQEDPTSGNAAVVTRIPYFESVARQFVIGSYAKKCQFSMVLSILVWHKPKEEGSQIKATRFLT